MSVAHFSVLGLKHPPPQGFFPRGHCLFLLGVDEPEFEPEFEPEPEGEPQVSAHLSIQRVAKPWLVHLELSRLHAELRSMQFIPQRFMGYPCIG